MPANQVHPELDAAQPRSRLLQEQHLPFPMTAVVMSSVPSQEVKCCTLSCCVDRQQCKGINSFAIHMPSAKIVADLRQKAHECSLHAINDRSLLYSSSKKHLTVAQLENRRGKYSTRALADKPAKAHPASLDCALSGSEAQEGHGECLAGQFYRHDRGIC